MCYFNNMAIAIRKIRPGAKRALIIDIDLHFGDGTVSIFRGDGDVKIVNPWSVEENFQYLELDESSYLGQEEDAFQGFDCDIVGVSAGFDTYLEYWGGLLKMEDYRKIGKAVREGAEKVCEGQRFAVLEVLDRLALADDWLVIGKFLVDLHSHNFLGRRESARGPRPTGRSERSGRLGKNGEED
jgi:acetoin utilization deacetylase AcuC-like enzyme